MVYLPDRWTSHGSTLKSVNNALYKIFLAIFRMFNWLTLFNLSHYFIKNCYLCYNSNYFFIHKSALTPNVLFELFAEYIYFFEVNTKYISSNEVKMSVIARVRNTSEIADIFNA